MNDAEKFAVAASATHVTHFRFTPEDDTFPIEVRMLLTDGDEGYFEFAVREHDRVLLRMPTNYLGKLLPLLEAAYAASPEGNTIGDTLADCGLDDA